VYQRTKDALTSFGKATSYSWRLFKDVLYRNLGFPIQIHIKEKLSAGVYAASRFMYNAKQKGKYLSGLLAEQVHLKARIDSCHIAG